MMSSIQQAASNRQAITRGWGGGDNSAAASPGTAGARPVRGLDASTSEGGVGIYDPPPREARESEELDSRESREDPTQEAVNLTQNKEAFKASLAVIKSVDRMIGTLLDVIV